MTAQHLELSRLLYEGEELIEETGMGDVQVAVTSHRALVFSQAEDGHQLHSIHLPNITGVSLDAGGDIEMVTRAVRFGVYSVILLGAGLFLNLDGLIDPISVPSSTLGIGQVIGLTNTFIMAISFLDNLLLLCGLGTSVIAIVFGFRYAQSRASYLEIERTTDDALQIPLAATHSSQMLVDRVESAIETASNTWKS